jgi:hypothetical protein
MEWCFGADGGDRSGWAVKQGSLVSEGWVRKAAGSMRDTFSKTVNYRLIQNGLQKGLSLR